MVILKGLGHVVQAAAFFLIVFGAWGTAFSPIFLFGFIVEWFLRPARVEWDLLWISLASWGALAVGIVIVMLLGLLSDDYI
jgi:hypothetical protein